jgi:hypothetical protein
MAHQTLTLVPILGELISIIRSHRFIHYVRRALEFSKLMAVSLYQNTEVMGGDLLHKGIHDWDADGFAGSAAMFWC